MTDPPASIRAATLTDVDVLVGLMSEFYAEAGFALPLVPASQAFSTLLATPALGLRALCVETGLDDHPARALYSRAGFVDIGHALLIQPLATPIHAMSADNPTSSA